MIAILVIYGKVVLLIAFTHSQTLNSLSKTAMAAIVCVLVNATSTPA